MMSEELISAFSVYNKSKSKKTKKNKRNSVKQILKEPKKQFNKKTKRKLSLDSPTNHSEPKSTNSQKKLKKTSSKTDINKTNAVQSKQETNSVHSETKKAIESKPNKNLKNENVGITLSPKNDSVKDGAEVFKWLINPVDIKKFFNTFWEKAPFLVHRNDEKYFSKLLSFNMIDKMLLENHVEFTKNIDITSYKDGIRETLNPEGRAMPNTVWDKYEDGCSIRLLNPQTFLSSIYALSSSLQEYFHCMVGANVYLTPPNSQGFAPHYDDIEALVLQIEGRKNWRLYNPRTKNEELPRFSSKNFTQDEIGDVILEKVLKPGDILYFPRGTIHQATTEPGYHSLHVTLSVYQRQSYADLFEKLLPIMLKRSIEENVELRKGLPLNLWRNMGVVHSGSRTKERGEIFEKCHKLLSSVMSNLPLDEAVDELAKKFQHEALPPNLTPAETCRTVFGSRNVINEKGQTVPNYEINLDSRIRLLRANIVRLIQEDDAEMRVYFYVDNSKEYQQYEPNFMEIQPEDAAAVDVLIKSYPAYIYVKQLPIDDDEKKICVAQALWERGILMLKDSIC